MGDITSKSLTPEQCAEMVAQYRGAAARSRELAEEYERNAERWELLAAGKSDQESPDTPG